MELMSQSAIRIFLCVHCTTEASLVRIFTMIVLSTSVFGALVKVFGGPVGCAPVDVGGRPFVHRSSRRL